MNDEQKLVSLNCSNLQIEWIEQKTIGKYYKQFNDYKGTNEEDVGKPIP